jgi:prepilin-type processing-associated H-X9-DG protein
MEDQRMNRIVSVAVVGVLALVLLGLGIPAVMRWRTLAERTRCEDHMRVVAVRTSEYAQREKAFPPGTVFAMDRPPERRLSWVVFLLPSLGYPEQAKQIDRSQPWDADVNRRPGAVLIKSLVCPSLIDATTAGGSGALHYPGIAGVGAEAATLDRSDPHAGIFGYDAPTPGEAVKDGTTNVLLLLETSRNIGPWIAGGPTSVRPVDPKEQPYLGEGRPFGGNHRGGANAAFADGHCQFLSEKISPAVLEMLAAMADGQSAPGP